MAGREKEFYEGLPDLSKIVPEDILSRACKMDDNEEGKSKGKWKGEDNLTSMNDLVAKLPLCDSVEKIDELSVQSCYLSTSPKVCCQLLESLFFVSILEMAPFYSRMIATISKLWPRFGKLLADTLYADYMPLIKKPGEGDKRMLLIFLKYIGELCKFGVIPPARVLAVFKELVLDIDQNLEAVKLFADTCGVFLVRCHGTTTEMISIYRQLREHERKEQERKEQERKRDAERKAKEIAEEKERQDM